MKSKLKKSKLSKLYNKIKGDRRGAVAVVEATLVFPVVLFILVILLVLGNVFYQQSRLDTMTVQAAEYLASRYTHPQLNDPTPTDPKGIYLYPYRYWASNKNATANDQARKLLENWLNNSDTGGFTGMDISKARIVECSIDGNLLYHTASVKLEYRLSLFPMKLLGLDIELPLMNAATKTAATDPAELIRNVDFMMDLYDTLNSAYDFQSKLSSMLNFFK